MPKKLVVDCSTGITSEVDMTPEEVAQKEADAIYFAELKTAREQEEAARIAAKASAEAKLAALGLTPEEIAAL